MARHRPGLGAFWALLAVVAIGCSQSVVEQRARPDDVAGTFTAETPGILTIGSAAPELDIEHWVHNGESRLQPVTSFVEGKVYVVEFWATWCGPCIYSIPHLSQLQRQYADQGVTLISISDEPLETNDIGEPAFWIACERIYRPADHVDAHHPAVVLGTGRREYERTIERPEGI